MNVYIITVKLFDIYHHQISLSDNVYTYVQFPSKSFHVNYSSPNGTYHVVQATVAGSGFINAYLVGVKNENGEKVKFQPEIRTSQQYIIYQSLQIFPSVLLLPWESSIEINHTVSFKVLGGSGFYKWSSTDTDIGSISYSSGKKSNIATVVIRKIGEINITVADAQNEFLHNMAKISVQPIADLEIMPTILETQVNNDVIVPVSLYGYEDEAKTKFKVFDECSKIPLNVEVVDKARFTYVKDTEYAPIGRGCQSLQFVCKFPGHSRIFVNYGNKLNTTTIIGCSKPLKPVYPERVAVVALGSLLEVAFEGGPRLWPMYKKGYYDNSLHILPENNWALHEMNVYIITVKLFDIYHHQISLSDNVYTYVQFPSKSFHVNYSSPNGTYHVVQATVAGSGFINAYLVGVKNENGEKVKFQPEIRTSQQYIIYQSLQIFPSVLLLPWESSIEINHTVSFKVLGGSGFYKWSSTDTDIGSISYSSGKKSNIATVVIRKIGEINITVADAQNEFLHNMAKISVQPIADLEIMPTILETQVNNDVIVPVSLYGYEDEAKTKFKVFDECSKIPLNVEVVDKARFTYVKGE
ncbi:nuclear pore membrane glycoprotein 210-like [Centruroides sculpturatus]|uniref:nuclear pore membrane glycoprotein 210-like n=1 Tax=Centruroides sculpturatus TaxID=218467 RepID=UPI000C6E3057|nr:nuclear pore membrane glycoprotein 210-like [Centruroides sculpturatus]